MSHIVLGSAAIDADCATLARVGWEVAFVEREIPTHPAKRPFMATASPAQSLAFLRRAGVLPIELIQYADALPPAPAPLQLVLPGPPPRAIGRVTPACGSPAHELLGALEAEAVALPGVTTPIWFRASELAPPFVIHFTGDAEAALSLWTRGAGLKSSAAGQRVRHWPTLELGGPLGRSTMRLVVCEAPAPTPSVAVADGPGFRCLSFHATDLSADCAALLAHGASASTDVMSLVVNKRRLATVMIAGVDGTLVELIQPHP